MKPKPIPASNTANNKYKKYLVWSIIFISGLLLGAILTHKAQPITQPTIPTTSTNNQDEVSEVRSGGYKFINPLLECNNFNPSDQSYFIRMKSELNDYITLQTSEGNLVHASVYCRDLNNGPWMGIDAEDDYSPASLLKLPVMIAVFRLADRTPSILKEANKYDQVLSSDYTANIPAEEKLKLGSTYTTEELVYRMMVYSDNEAAQLLLKTYGVDILNKEVNELGIKLANVGKSEDFMSAVDYSTFFRMLYNANYLSKDLSEKALKIMSNCKFKNGIVAGVPEGIIVAHKFGERVFPQENTMQLHDCGIVYAGNKPYLVCIMTRGKDFTKSSSCIAEMSSIIYRNINSQN